jgi:AbiV family abortive infection protein
MADAVRACLTNGRRLLEDAEVLELNEPPTTAYFLTMIAQEEFAKGFLLALVVRGVIPWDEKLLRAARDHACKQLLCVVMDYLSPDTDDFLERGNAVVLRHEVPQLPARVMDAINILRHEKIRRWVSQSWVWAEDPEYDPDAVAIWEGKQDRLKQDALYVRLASDGGIASVPAGITRETVRTEHERADRLARLTEGVLRGEAHPGLDYDRVEELFRVLFATTGDSQVSA